MNLQLSNNHKDLVPKTTSLPITTLHHCFLIITSILHFSSGGHLGNVGMGKLVFLNKILKIIFEPE